MMSQMFVVLSKNNIVKNAYIISIIKYKKPIWLTLNTTTHTTSYGKYHGILVLDKY